MEISVYNLIFNQMKSLGLFTEILESFDWDETAAKNFYEDVSNCLLSEEMVQRGPLPKAFLYLAEILNEKGYSELQINIVKRIVEIQAKELVELNQMEVH